MEILRDKIVKTRKAHRCSACNRNFYAGTVMRVQVNTYEDQLGTWRECPTCHQLLDRHRSIFADEYNVCQGDCVNEIREYKETPEELLIRLDKALGINQ